MHEQAEAAGVVLSEGLTKQLAEMDDRLRPTSGSRSRATPSPPSRRSSKTVDVGGRGHAQPDPGVSGQRPRRRRGGAGSVRSSPTRCGWSRKGSPSSFTRWSSCATRSARSSTRCWRASQALGKMAVAVWAGHQVRRRTFSHMRAAGTEASAEMQKAFYDRLRRHQGRPQQPRPGLQKCLQDHHRRFRDAGDRMRDALHPPDGRRPGESRRRRRLTTARGARRPAKSRT